MPLMPTISSKNDRPPSIVNKGDNVTITRRPNPYTMFNQKTVKFSGTVYEIDYLPINRSRPDGDYVDYISIKFPAYIYKEILAKGWTIYARLHPDLPIKKYYISDYDYKGKSVEILPDGCYIGPTTVLPIENIEAIMIWHVLYEVVREPTDFTSHTLMIPPF